MGKYILIDKRRLTKVLMGVSLSEKDTKNIIASIENTHDFRADLEKWHKDINKALKHINRLIGSFSDGKDDLLYNLYERIEEVSETLKDYQEELKELNEMLIGDDEIVVDITCAMQELVDDVIRILHQDKLIIASRRYRLPTDTERKITGIEDKILKPFTSR
jgi:DNA repair exonuclease SbcCD ATPase subunit